jgi:hypothetical protein
MLFYPLSKREQRFSTSCLALAAVRCEYAGRSARERNERCLGFALFSRNGKEERVKRFDTLKKTNDSLAALLRTSYANLRDREQVQPIKGENEREKKTTTFLLFLLLLRRDGPHLNRPQLPTQAKEARLTPLDPVSAHPAARSSRKRATLNRSSANSVDTTRLDDGVRNARLDLVETGNVCGTVGGGVVEEGIEGGV